MSEDPIKIIIVQGPTYALDKDALIEKKYESEEFVFDHKVEPDSYEVVLESIELAGQNGQIPILFFGGHGINTTTTGFEHEMGLDAYSGDESTIDLITQAVDKFKEIFPNKKLNIAISSCHSGSLIKQLDQKLLKHCNIIVNDSEQNVIWRDDDDRYLENFVQTKGNLEETFLRELAFEIKDERSVNYYSLPSLVTSRGVVDGDYLRDVVNVNEGNFQQLKSQALNNLASEEFENLPTDLVKRIRETIESLEVNNFTNFDNERESALLGFFAIDKKERYISLKEYTNDNKAIESFFEPEVGEEELIKSLKSLDENVQGLILRQMTNVCDRPNMQDFLDRYEISEEDFKSKYEILLNNAKNIDSKNGQGNTALQISIKNQNFDLARDIISSGANINLEMGGIESASATGHLTTILHDSMTHGDVEFVNYLIENGADVNSVNSSGETTLLTLSNKPIKSSSYKRVYGVMNSLVENDAKVNFRSSTDETALIRVSGSGEYGSDEYRIPLLELLLENDAEVDARDRNGATALSDATLNENFYSTRFLIENGADVNAIEKNGMTPLALAALLGNFEVSELLINNGADLNFINAAEKDVLCIACEGGDRRVVELLIKNGAEITQAHLDEFSEDWNISDALNYGVKINQISQNFEDFITEANVSDGEVDAVEKRLLVDALGLLENVGSIEVDNQEEDSITVRMKNGETLNYEVNLAPNVKSEKITFNK